MMNILHIITTHNRQALFVFIICAFSFLIGCIGDGGMPNHWTPPITWVVHYDLDSAVLVHKPSGWDYYYFISLYQDYRGYDSIPFKMKGVFHENELVDFISLRGNNISSIPCWLMNPPVHYSIDLDLTNNNFSSFDPALLYWNGSLTLDSNSISSLPFDQTPPVDICGYRWANEFGKSDLTRLYLNYNNIRAFPDTIAMQFNHLYTLSLIGNPIPHAEQERIRKLFPNTKEVRF